MHACVISCNFEHATITPHSAAEILFVPASTIGSACQIATLYTVTTTTYPCGVAAFSQLKTARDWKQLFFDAFLPQRTGKILNYEWTHFFIHSSFRSEKMILTTVKFNATFRTAIKNFFFFFIVLQKEKNKEIAGIKFCRDFVKHKC